MGQDSIMKRTSLSSLAIAAGLTALCLAPAFAQERPAPQGHGGGADRAVSRPSGGGGGGGGSHSAPTPSGGSTGSSSGGSSAGAPSGGGHGGRAVPREGTRGTAAARSRTGAAKPVIIPRGASEAPEGAGVPHRERTDPSYSRPRAGRPATGSAVPRDISNVPPQLWPQDPYWGYYYYSRWTPFYWGPWGGYMYYDPYWWDYYYGYGYFPYGYGGYGGYTHYYSESDYDTGGLKLKVKPREAQVYVDGYFSGIVDDYDGVFQKLRLRSGGHRIEIRSGDLQPAIFDVLIVAGETVTYRAELKPKP
jgi:hypothetical protein